MPPIMPPAKKGREHGAKAREIILVVGMLPRLGLGASLALHALKGE